MNSAKQVDAMIAAWTAEGLTRSEIVVKTCIAMLEWAYVWGAVGKDCTPAIRKQYMNRSGLAPGDVALIKKHCPVLSEKQTQCHGCKYYPNDERTRVNDCQGFAKQVFSAAGITLSGGGCTTMYANNANWAAKGELKDMPLNVVCCVFKQVWNKEKQKYTMDHIGVHIGNGDIIHCSVEVKTGKITDKGWTHYAIPKGIDGKDIRPTLRRGDRGVYVTLAQTELIQKGYSCGEKGADGIFGKDTEKAVKLFQCDNGLVVDGIIGQKTWDALDSTEPIKSYTVTIPHLSKTQADALILQYPGATITEERGVISVN